MPPNLRPLETFIRKTTRKHRIPGLAFLLTQNGRRLVAKGYGYRDVAARLPVTPRTVFGIASVTKSFTALGILRLQEEGRLRVTDPVVRHLPEFGTPDPRSTRRIQLHHFLTHSSGLPPLPSIYFSSARSLARDPVNDPRAARKVGIDPDHPPIDTYEQMLEYLRSTRYQLLGPPGRYFSYSNEAFGLLGAVIERVSGRHFEQFLEEEILGPAGMRSTTFDTGIMLRSPEVTTLYSPPLPPRKRGWGVSQDWWEDTCLRGAGALRTNLEDLERYLEIFRTGGRVGATRIVSSASLRAMMHPHVPVSPGVFYGYGLAVQPGFPGGPLVSHSGGLKGVASLIAVLPKRGITSAVLANLGQAPSGLAVQAGINLLASRPLTQPLAEVPPRPPRPRTFGEYAGYYCSGEGIWFTVRPIRTGLRLDFIGIEFTERNVRMTPNGHDEFIWGRRGRLGYVRFERDGKGRIWAAFVGWRLVRRRAARELPLARHHRIVW
ncbi:MAG: beta-lactamase family protein [Thermoplasmata archaeon]|nr:beta-lactamase family protein [Thermoplasmata archaeon]